MKQLRRSVTADGVTVEYTLIYKQVKNINMSVRAGGEVTVSANPRVPVEVTDDFVCRKIPFIRRAVERLEQAKKQKPPTSAFLAGEKVPYLGSTLELVVQDADRRRIPEWIAMLQAGELTSLSRNRFGEALFLKEGKLYLYSLDTEDSDYKRKLYEAWQKLQTGLLCEQLLQKYYPYFKKLEIPYPVMKIRKMSSRWGSCIPAKHKVTFNSLLIEKPIAAIEYVVVHELAHFVHPDHSPAFYQFVEEILPDWEMRRRMLRV